MESRMEAFYRAVDVSQEPGFLTLTSSDTSSEEFERLLAEHVAGYTQKKRLAEGIKDLVAKVDAAEQKMHVAKNVGKAKGVDVEDRELCEKYDGVDLKEKLKLLNAAITAHLEEGKLTAEEKPQILEHLTDRRKAAVAAEKTKLQEKLEKQIVTVSALLKTDFVVHPVPNTAEIHAMKTTLESIEILEKRPLRSLTEEDREELSRKGDVQDAISKLEKISRMWFETDLEFNPRLQNAIAMRADELKELTRLAEERALEAKRLAEDQALEEKRLAQQQAEERKAAEVAAKIEAKRQEAALKPVKPIPQKQVKEKVVRTVIDNRSLGFADAEEDEADRREREWIEAARAAAAEYREAAEAEAAHEAKKAEAAKAAAKAEEDGKTAAKAAAKAASSAALNGTSKNGTSKTPAKPAPPIVAPLPPSQRAPAPKKEPKERVVVESKWGVSAADIAVEDEGCEVAGPSLADAVKIAPKDIKKGPVMSSQPKKAEKKKWGKVDVADLGFEEAEARREQEWKEQIQREYREAEAEAKAAEEARKAKAAEEARKKAAAATADATVAAAPSPARAAAPDVAKPVVKEAPLPPSQRAAEPKKVPRAAAAIESKWGTPVAGGPGEEDPDAEAEDAAGPSLAESVKAAPKQKMAPPPRSTKKKFTKVAAENLGFD